ncbi:hypothetical protein ACFQH6_14360 [Halobacteriaceae archaeon GCM10025711]
MRWRDRIGVTVRRQRQICRLMQLSLVGFFFIGLDRGEPGIVVNSLVALGVTYLPAVLERDYQIPMDAGLTLWITTAVFLHALGTLGPYTAVSWWDHVTHVLSSSVVAATGYAFTRAIDLHTDDIRLPPRFMFAFILLFVVAFGVLWEVIEFGVGGASAMLGTGHVLTQYGLADTMNDLLFDILGGVVVAIWGTAYLTDVVGAITSRLQAAERGG